MLDAVAGEQAEPAVVQAERHLRRDLAVGAAEDEAEVVLEAERVGGLAEGGRDGLELGGVGGAGGGQGIFPGRAGRDPDRRPPSRGYHPPVDEISALSYPVAFAAGFVSFASPCVLALVPGYLCFISGVSFDELGSRTRDVLTPTIAFVLASR